MWRKVTPNTGGQSIKGTLDHRAILSLNNTTQYACACGLSPLLSFSLGTLRERVLAPLIRGFVNTLLEFFSIFNIYFLEIYWKRLAITKLRTRSSAINRSILSTCVFLHLTVEKYKVSGTYTSTEFLVGIISKNMSEFAQTCFSARLHPLQEKGWGEMRACIEYQFS